MFLVFIVSLVLFCWGFSKGPIFNWEDYDWEKFDGYPPNPYLFFGSSAAASVGIFGMLISGLFITGVLPRGH